MFSGTNITTNYIRNLAYYITLLIDLTPGKRFQILCERRWGHVQKWHRAVVPCTLVSFTALTHRYCPPTSTRHCAAIPRRHADISSRTRLCSSTSSQLMVRPSRLVTVRERSLASAGQSLRKSVADNITTASSLSDFRRKLKTHLFRQSYPDIVW